jgi:hypothetical protein
MMCTMHIAMGHGPWLQGFDDVVDHSRITLCQAWESRGFMNHKLQTIECHCALKGYIAYDVSLHYATCKFRSSLVHNCHQSLPKSN